jgi:hypothetical protein
MEGDQADNKTPATQTLPVWLNQHGLSDLHQLLLDLDFTTVESLQEFRRPEDYTLTFGGRLYGEALCVLPL